jgi:23S rRNA pseudouridine1911/1915/1917 synthase
MREYRTEPAQHGSRLDVVVSTLYPQFTRSSLEMLFDRGMVKVDGRAAKGSYRVRAAENVQVDETYLKNQPPAVDLPIIYEDDGVIVINKPAGLLTHSKGALNLEPTVASFIKDKITDEKMAGNRAGIIHRLDRGTSGVIITAKNQVALRWLQKQFSQRKVKKSYVAIVEGIPNPNKALIDAPISRNPKRPQTFKVMAAGRPAQTEFEVKSEFKKDGKNYSQLELQPLTGRTHQLRVHLSYIGHPIVGDNLYGRNNRPILLHARSLELTLPNKERLAFSVEAPKIFKEFTNNE